MESYCVSCEKNSGKENSSIRNNKHNRLMLLSNCAACEMKLLRFIKNQDPDRLELH